MPTRESISNSKALIHLATSTRTATGTPSTAVDTQGYDALQFAVFYGTAGDTLSASVTIEVDIQESDLSGSGFAAAPDSAIVVERSNGNTTGAAVGTANGATSTGAAFLAIASAQLSASPVIRVAYVGSKRFVKCIDTRAGTQSSGTSSTIIAILSHAEYNPSIGNAS